MAVMHCKTFEIYHNDQLIVPEDYIDVDELIAPTIQILNQKGYTTRFCCSGHPLTGHWLWRDAGAEEGYRKAGAPLMSYIAFEEGITLPSLPPGFVERPRYGGNPRLVIEKDHPITSAAENQFFAKAQRILETMKELYEWALELPDFEPEQAAETEKPETAVEVLDFCNQKISEYALGIKPVDAVYTCERMKLLITYTSDDHPDLRELLKALAMKFHVKVELRQCKG